MKNKTNLIKCFMVVILFLTATALFSQVSLQWSAAYNGPGNGIDRATSMAIDRLGNVYVTGYSLGVSNDYATVKYTSSGSLIWVQRYDSANGQDRANSIAVDASGNVYVTGYSSVNSTGQDYLTIKYDSSGTRKWAIRYDGGISGIDQATALAVDAAGNVFVTGSATGAGNLRTYVTIKYNSSGVQQWVKSVTGGGNGTDIPAALVIDASSNVYVTGKGYSGASTGYDYFTVKYNSAGDFLWSVKYANMNTASDDAANSVAVDSTGNIYVTGSSRTGATSSTSDYATVKYNSAGVQQWVKRYNGTGNAEDNARSVGVDRQGNIFVTGESWETGTAFDFTTIKYNPAGDQQWIVKENGPSNQSDRGYSLAIDSTGSIYAAGYSVGSTSAEDLLTIKYNSDGIQLWSRRENGAGNSYDIPADIKVDGSGSVLVTGYSATGSNEDFITLKYNQPNGIVQISSEVASSYRLQQNYPNPFNPVTNIAFSIPKSGSIMLRVFDISGRVAAVLIDGKLSAGSYNYDFDASQLASGIYFYKLESNDFSQTKKMILVK